MESLSQVTQVRTMTVFLVYHDQYVQQRHDWNNHTWEAIERFLNFWEALQKIATFSSGLKFVHDQLPLGEKWFWEASLKDESLKFCPTTLVVFLPWLALFCCDGVLALPHLDWPMRQLTSDGKSEEIGGAVNLVYCQTVLTSLLISLLMIPTFSKQWSFSFITTYYGSCPTFVSSPRVSAVTSCWPASPDTGGSFRCQSLHVQVLLGSHNTHSKSICSIHITDLLTSMECFKTPLCIVIPIEARREGSIVWQIPRHHHKCAIIFLQLQSTFSPLI